MSNDNTIEIKKATIDKLKKIITTEIIGKITEEIEKIVSKSVDDALNLENESSFLYKGKKLSKYKVAELKSIITSHGGTIEKTQTRKAQLIHLAKRIITANPKTEKTHSNDKKAIKHQSKSPTSFKKKQKNPTVQDKKLKTRKYRGLDLYNDKFIVLDNKILAKIEEEIIKELEFEEISSFQNNEIDVYLVDGMNPSIEDIRELLKGKGDFLYEDDYLSEEEESEEEESEEEESEEEESEEEESEEKSTSSTNDINESSSVEELDEEDFDILNSVIVSNNRSSNNNVIEMTQDKISSITTNK